MESNTKKSFYNIITGILGQVITIALGILIPKLVLVNLGSEANGLLNSIAQVLGYVGLLEAGVGMASLQALYKPIAINDRNAINSIMSATHAYYKKTGTFYFIAVILLAFIYPQVVESSIGCSTMVAVILISGLPGAINYYLQGKYKILLQAEGKSYITTNLATFVSVLTSIGKIILLLLGFGVVAVQLLCSVLSLAQMAYIYIYIKRHYQWLDLSTPPAFDKIAQKNSALLHQVSGLVFNNTDTVLLSVFCGLSVVSVYSMYTMLFGMISTLLSNIANGITFALGQQMYADMDLYKKRQNVFELIHISLSFSLILIACLFITPFLKLYTNGITDINYIDAYLPFLFASIYLLECSRTSSAKTIHIAGHFKQTQSHALIEMLINISVTIPGVMLFGIYGALFGTIAALFYRANVMIIYANKRILNRSPWKTYRRWLINLGMFIIVTLVSKRIFTHIALDTYPRIILWAAISCVIIVPLFFVVASIFDKETFLAAKEMLSPYFKKLLSKLHKAH